MRTTSRVLGVLTLLLAAEALSGPVRLVKDINPNGAPSSSPTGFTEMGGELYFFVQTEPPALWKTDGTGDGTVEVLSDSRLRLAVSGWGYGPAASGGIIYFLRWDARYRHELWRTDGTSSGTQPVSAALNASSVESLTDLDGTLFFSATTPESGKELWRTDGTPEGTRMVKDIWPGVSGSFPRSLFGWNGVLLFVAQSPEAGEELWISDGTEAGTRLLADITPGPKSSYPTSSGYGDPFVPLNGVLYFSGYDPEHGRELWRTDGTAAGTRLAVDVAVGPDSSSPYEMASLGKRLVFAESGGALWSSDGTLAGSQRLLDGPWSYLVGSNGSAFAFELTWVGSGYSTRLVQTDGTAAGTHEIRRLPYSCSPLVSVNGRVLFNVWNGTTSELWVSDGTAAETRRAQTLPPGTYPSTGGAVFRGAFLFGGWDLPRGRELWRSDGTASGTSLVKDVLPGNASSNPSGLLAWQGNLYFNGNTGVAGLMIRSDGTEGGTAPVWNGTNAVPWLPASLTPSGDRLLLTGYFSYDTGRTVWTSDGSAEGTKPIWENDSSPGSAGPFCELASFTGLFPLGGRHLFRAFDGAAGNELFSTDGTEDGTLRLRDVRPGPTGSFPSALVRLADAYLFFADGGLHGRELWRTDGTEAGTTLLADLRPGPDGSVEEGEEELVGAGGRVFFAADDGTHGLELWQSDGTVEGTRLVNDIRPGWRGSEPRALTVSSGGVDVWFAADDGLSGEEPWRSDGTAEGTTLVLDVWPGPIGSMPYEPAFTRAGAHVYFAAEDPLAGVELWRSDGQPSGTALVKDLAPGSLSSRPRNLLEVDGALYFAADDAEHGEEVFQTDGTADRTVLVDDVNPGPASSRPGPFTRLGNELFLAADRFDVGRELFAFAIEPRKIGGVVTRPADRSPVPARAEED